MSLRSPSRAAAALFGLASSVALAAGCDGNGLTTVPRTSSADGVGFVSSALCASGQICTIAGTGIAGDGADELAAKDTRLYLPQDMTAGPDGRLYVVDWNNHRIRSIDDAGVMHIVAGIGELGASIDDPSTERLNHPTHVAFDPMGAPGEMIIAAWHNSRIKKCDLATTSLVDIAGTGKRGFNGNGMPALLTTLDLPVAVVFDAAGDMLFADQANQMIRKIDRATNVITTIAGVGRCADSTNPNPCIINDGGPATQGGFHFPIGQAASPGGRIALGLDGSIYVADTENFRLRRVSPDGMLETFAGTGTWGFAGDGGPAKQAQLGRLSDVAVARDGRIFIADTDNSCVRVIAPNGIITTFAGQCGARGFSGDAGPAAAAKLDRPSGVEIGPLGDVFIADTHNNRIRVVGR